jgi:uncharacterized membrane protein (TIGR02234 family)
MNDSDKRELGGVLLLIALGGGGAVFTASRTWLSIVVPRVAPFGPLHTDFNGRQLSPALNGLAIVALITAVLVLVTGGWARRVLGVLLVVVAVSAGWYAIRGRRAPSAGRVRELLGDRLNHQAGPLQVQAHPWLAWLTLLCALLLLLAGLLLVARAGRWQSGLSAKYNVPAESSKSYDPWRRLDRGEDPTITDG